MTIEKRLWAIVKDKDPDEHQDYLNWYDDACSMVYAYAEAYGHDVKHVAAATAALSCNSSWSRNKKALQELMEGAKVKHVGQVVEMATKALASGFEALSGPKVTSFALNLVGDRESVTVDRVMCFAAGLKKRDGTPKRTPSDADILDIGDAVTRVADRYNQKWGGDFKPAQIKALIWCLIKGGKE